MVVTATSRRWRDVCPATGGKLDRERGFMRANNSVLTVLRSLIASAAFALALAPGAFAAEKKPTVSPKVAAALQAAQKAIPAKQFEEAAKKIAEAEAVKKTDFDQYQINEFKAYLYGNQGGNIPELIDLYEKSLEFPQWFDAKGLLQRYKQLSVVTFNNKMYDKAAKYAKQWLEQEPNDKTALDVLSKAYYLNKNYADARQVLDTMLGNAEKAGEKPDEMTIKLAQSCASEMGDEASVVKGFEKLVRHYPTPENWEKLLFNNMRAERNDQALLNMYRLQADVGAMTSGEQYAEYGRLALAQAMPGEAKRIVEKGFELKVLGVNAKEKVRQQQLLNDAKKKTTEDLASLPQLEKDVRASKSTTGQVEAGLGLAYFSNDMDDQAIEWLEAGLKKGGMKEPDNYRMALGVAYLRKGNKDQARATFAAVQAGSPLAKAANLWTIRTYN